MIYNIKRNFTILSLVIFGSVLLYNCEPDPDSLGEQLFTDGAANGAEKSYDLTAYNINNNDSIRSDAGTLAAGVIGAFSESQFGLQKASYITQVRMSAYNPDFGTNAVVDSAVLVIKPLYATDSVTTTTDENYVFHDGNVAAKKVINTYPVKKYGKAKINNAVPEFTLKVHEVTDFLGSLTDAAYSNKNYAVSSEELASKKFNGNVSSIAITKKDGDNAALFTSTADFRIPLKASFFQNKIIAKNGQLELKDVSNFIRHFRGIKISVEENDGYLFQISPSDASTEIIMYYKNDKTENGVTTRPQSSFRFPLGTGNAHIGQYKYERAGSQFPAYVTDNQTTGHPKLYAQGMGGPSIGVRFPKETIDSLKNLYNKNKAAIISARIRMYTDTSVWKNGYTKPNLLTIVQKNTQDVKSLAFTQDMLVYGGQSNLYRYMTAYDLLKDRAYYEFVVTKALKDIVETGEAEESYSKKYFKIDIGEFLVSSDQAMFAGPKYTTRAFARERMVFVGSDHNNPDKIQLKVVYSTK